MQIIDICHSKYHEELKSFIPKYKSDDFRFLNCDAAKFCTKFILILVEYVLCIFTLFYPES
jgi:hypothetical protein